MSRTLALGVLLAVALGGCFDFTADFALCRMQHRCSDATGGGTANTGGGASNGGGTGGGVACSAATCANGCCDQGQCKTVFPACGSGAAACYACDPWTSNACGAASTCTCGGGPACDSHKSCDGAACVCKWPWQPCASGCCPVSAGLLAAGGNHTCALTPSGGVKCWGSNIGSQLGNGTVAGMPQGPGFVVGLDSGASGVTAGLEHTCAWMTDGGVKCWGTNDRGELGSDGMTTHPEPLDVPGLPAVVQVAAGREFTCAVAGGGAVSCWGDNMDFQLAWDGGDNSNGPVDTGVMRASRVATGSGACAVLDGGALACWGDGQQSPTLTGGGFNDVAYGYHFSCGPTATATLCWGDGFQGQLGDGTRNGHLLPMPVTGLGPAQAVSCGSDHACAVTPDGKVLCWGYDSDGECGSGTIPDSGVQLVPVVVQGLPKVMAVAAGDRHTCAMAEDGRVFCWGLNDVFSQQLGGATDAGFSTTPLRVPGL